MALGKEKIVIQDPVRVAPATDLATPAQVELIERQASAAKITGEKQDVSTDGSAEAKLYGDIGIEAMGGGLLKMATSMIEVMDDHASGQNKVTSFSSSKPRSLGEEVMDRVNMFSGSFNMKSPERLDGTGEYSDIKALQADSAADTLKASVVSEKKLLLQNSLANKAALDSVKVYEQKYDAALAHGQQSAPGFGMGMSGPSINLRTLQSEAENAMDEEFWKKNMKEQQSA